MAFRKRTFLDYFFGPWVLRVLGVEYPERPTLEVVAGDGITVAAEDVPSTDATRLIISADNGAEPMLYVDTTTNAANQVIDAGSDLPEESITRVDVSAFVKKNGAAAGGVIELAGIYMRNGSSAPVRIGMACPCGSTTTTRLLDNQTGNGSPGTAPTNWYPGSVNYTATGGKCRIRFWATGFTNSASQTITLNLKIDGSVVKTAPLFVNDASKHTAFPMGYHEITLSAGTHTIGLTLTGTGASGNTDDRANIVIEEEGTDTDPAQYSLSGSTLDGTTADLHINGNKVEARVSPETAETLHWGIKRVQTSAEFG